MEAMTIRSILQAIVHPRTVTEDLGPPSQVAADVPRLAGSLQLRHVDAGSCNGCELEITPTFGPVTINMVGPLVKTFEAMPEPRMVIALGDCARDCGVFRGGYGVEGPVGDVLPVDLQVPGCPPNPEAIVRALRGLTGR